MPDVALYAQYYHQTLTAVIPQNNVTGGVSFSWTIADFGRRRSAVEVTAARQLAAGQEAARVEERTATAVAKAYRAAVRAERLWDMAVATASAWRDLARVAAEVGARVARADLARAVGAAGEPLTPGATSSPK